MFDKVGQIIYPIAVTDADAMFEAALEAGAQDVETDDETYLVTTAPEDFNTRVKNWMTYLELPKRRS